MYIYSKTHFQTQVHGHSLNLHLGRKITSQQCTTKNIGISDSNGLITCSSSQQISTSVSSLVPTYTYPRHTMLTAYTHIHTCTTHAHMCTHTHTHTHTFSGCVDLLGESGDHPAGSIMLVEGVGQLWKGRETDKRVNCRAAVRKVKHNALTSFRDGPDLEIDSY